MQKFISKWTQRHPVRTRRFLEILPGFVSWSLILFPIWGSFFIPTVVAYYVIAFAVYWLYRSLSVAALSLIGHLRLQAAERYDWLGDLKAFPDWKKVHHVILIPTYKEPLNTLRRSIEGLKKQTYPKKKLHLVVSFEEREGEAGYEKAKSLEKEFARTFGTFITTFHPDIAGEVKGKSSNSSWAAKLAKRELIDKGGIDIGSMTITSCDADSVLHPNYFALLAYKFLDHPKRYRRLWQPLVVFYNNFWKVPSPIRALVSISSVVHYYTLMRTDILINYSTYSTSFKLVDEVGYWDTDVIPEDWRLFFKSYFHFKGDLEVEPIFLSVRQDAAHSTTFWKTMANQYEQIKRWAWGVSDNPYIMIRFLTVSGLPFWNKLWRMFQFVQFHFLWPVNWFAITLGAFLPPLLNETFARTILGKTLPQVASAILTIALVSVLVLWVINLRQRPKTPEGVSTLKKWLAPFELLLLPVVGFFFTALPGLDAHTRLMLGKYIEYKVTEKV